MADQHHQHHPHQQREQEEGVLKDVLDELDRERSRRAELQAMVRQLEREKQQQQQQQQRAVTMPSVSHRVFRSMEVQVEGYREIIDALTLSKPAIAAAAAMEKEEAALSQLPTARRGKKATSTAPKTLPLHVVRLLEVLPWDPRAKQHVFAAEEIFEWQVFREGVWQSHLRYFPTQFKTLPVFKASSSSSSTASSSKQINNTATTGLGREGIPQQVSTSMDSKKDRSILSFLAGGENSSINNNSTIGFSRRKAEHRILTNERITVLYDADAGLPLSQQDGGTWEWLGSWRISKHETAISASNLVAATTTEAELEAQKRSDCDEQGWSYVVEPQDFLLGLPDMIWDNAGEDDATETQSAATDSTTFKANKSSGAASSSNNTTMPKRTFRRRRWIRQRILVDYPHASESTRQYLLLLRENARLSAAASKISDQLVETKTALTESEEKLMEARDLLRRRDAALRAAGITVEEDGAELDDDFEDSLLQSASTTDKVPMMQYSIAPDMVRSMSKEGAGAFGSKITQWVQAARKTSEDLTSLDDESEEASNNGSGHGASSSLPDQQQQSLSPMDKFDWKKLGRGSPFIHKLKSPNRSGTGPLLTNQFRRSGSGSGRNIFRKADSTSLNRVGAPPFPTSTSAD